MAFRLERRHSSADSFNAADFGLNMIWPNQALDRVVVVPYDPNWPSLYQAEERLLRSCLSSLIRDLEHIGSTAVPPQIAPGDAK